MYKPLTQLNLQWDSLKKKVGVCNLHIVFGPAHKRHGGGHLPVLSHETEQSCYRTSHVGWIYLHIPSRSVLSAGDKKRCTINMAFYYKSFGNLMKMGRALLTQVFGHQPPTTKGLGSIPDICGEQSVNGIGFSSSSSLFLQQYHSTNVIFIYLLSTPYNLRNWQRP
jgi:hypothetical protein